MFNKVKIVVCFVCVACSGVTFGEDISVASEEAVVTDIGMSSNDVAVADGDAESAQDMPFRRFGVRLGLLGSSPKEDELWENSIGFELLGRYQINRFVGLAIGVGMEEWDLVEIDSIAIIQGGSIRHEESGSSELISFGPSVLITPSKPSDAMKFEFELGVRYVLVDVDVQGVYRLRSSWAGEVLREEYEYKSEDDALLGCISAGLTYDWNDRITFFGSVGFRIDLQKSKLTAETTSLTGQAVDDGIISMADIGEWGSIDNELGGIFYRAGVELQF